MGLLPYLSCHLLQPKEEGRFVAPRDPPVQRVKEAQFASKMCTVHQEASQFSPLFKEF